VRYGLIADVHANLPALTAVLAELEVRGVDRYLCAGDVIGYGPHPAECVRAVAALRPVWVLGNHELMLLGRYPAERATATARRALEWTRRVLDADVVERLAELPLTVSLADGLVIAHGSLSSPTMRILGKARVRDELDRLRTSHPEARILVLGHTHRAMMTDGQRWAGRSPLHRRMRLEAGRAYIVNPGSVGQSRGFTGHARAAVLDTDAGTLEMLALRYPTAALKRDLASASLPTRSHHCSPLSRLGRRARRLLRRSRPDSPFS
jgi:predicted phosphodiesterase